jgi:hypothetical protein
MIGRKFGKLRVVSLYRKKRAMACCVCACGNSHRVRVSDLERGHTRSCSCLKRAGHKHSAAAREKLSRAARARVVREAHRKRMEVQQCSHPLTRF